MDALLYETVEDEKVRCNLCAHRCLIYEGRMGICQVRENREGKLYTLTYGHTISQHVDPVEKKPLYHFYPGTRAYSMATPGCNFRCGWCQNWQIAQMPREGGMTTGQAATPAEIVASARRTNCRSIAYTYTEPTIFFEYAYDIARQAHQANIANIYVTNGYMTREMLDMFRPYLDGANVDLKGFRDETYRKHVGARLQPILDNLKYMKELGIWVEVTTLIIPGLNDDEAELKEAAQFIATELGPETPWHISRFFPAYKMRDVSPTPVATLQKAQALGRTAGLRYTYIGNAPGEENTYCHQCQALLVRRSGFSILKSYVTPDETCPDCGAPVDGVGMGG